MTTAMRNKFASTWPAVTRLLALVILGGCADQEKSTKDDTLGFSEAQISLLLRHRFDPTPVVDPTNSVSGDPAAERLGQYLFFDTGLSGSGEHSCASCHKPEHGFADPDRLSTTEVTVERHTPTVVNSGYNRWFYWDGRCDTLWCQAAGPIEDPDEHGSNRLAVAHHIFDDAALSEAYTSIFGPLPDLSDTDRFPLNAMPTEDPSDPLGEAWSEMDEDDATDATEVFINVTKAIGAYEALLVQGNAPFDQMLDAFEDDDATGGPALSDDAKAGAMLFVGDANCWACHSGPTFTNKEFHNVALPAVDGIDNASPGRHTGIDVLLNNPFNSWGEFSDDTSDADEKLGHLVQSPEQMGSFKTPSLRNLQDTAPYMHGGHFETLTEAVQHYSDMDDPPLIGHREELLLPQLWTDDEIAQVVAFLESLQGEPIDPELLSQPDSPL